MLADQGLDVVCATISMFRECQEWNRANIVNYREIYLRVPMQVLMARDQKQLYSRAARGEMLEVMGVDLTADEPRNPDAVVENDGRMSPEQVAASLNDQLLKS
jgi:adenylylsulfate kinase-like enzyme